MNWTLSNIDLILGLTLEHIRLSIIPIVASFFIAIPLGWLANRNKVMRSVVIGIGSLLYTIPALPLFLILPSILGTRVLDDANLIVALTIYGVAIMVRSAADGLAAVDPVTVDAASAMGLGPAARFFRVELPLAGPVLLAGIRVVSVSTIALVSIGVIIGSENLGLMFTNGRARDNLEQIVVGILLSLLIAVVFDAIIQLIGRLLMPWNVAGGDRIADRQRSTPPELEQLPSASRGSMTT